MATKAQLQERCLQLESENRELRRILSRAERELNNRLRDDELPPEEIPPRISGLMKYHCMPWEVFFCYEHKQWVDELDSSFPYSMSDNRCPGCSGGTESDCDEDILR